MATTVLQEVPLTRNDHRALCLVDPEAAKILKTCFSRRIGVGALSVSGDVNVRTVGDSWALLSPVRLTATKGTSNWGVW